MQLDVLPCLHLLRVRLTFIIMILLVDLISGKPTSVFADDDRRQSYRKPRESGTGRVDSKKPLNYPGSSGGRSLFFRSKRLETTIPRHWLLTSSPSKRMPPNPVRQIDSALTALWHEV
ncbi:hypothetical protein DER45DRAFT_135152 [Fusarium avenaceum]|nr:hypothetical protein DER45DRAFT_135152 [Fusarium avenaceum]